MNVTTVNVDAMDVLILAELGIDAIHERRKAELNRAINYVMQERYGFIKRLLGWPEYKPKSRADAIEELKRPLSTYFHITRYNMITTAEGGNMIQLTKLRNMARSSIDNLLTLGMEDHALLRAVAERAFRENNNG